MTDRLTALPEDLELLAPGPELAAVLESVDRSVLSGADRTRLAVARGRLVSHVQAELMADVYAMSLDEAPDEEALAEPRRASRYPWAEVELAFAMRWTRHTAGGRLEQARQLIEDLPAVWQALATGEIDMPKVWVICDLVGGMADVGLARSVADRVLERASELTTGQLRARLRKLVLAADPEASTRRCVAAVAGRRVEQFPADDGTGELCGRGLPAADTAAAFERLTAIARAARAAGDHRRIDQLRADAFLDLLVGEGVAVGGPVSVHDAGLPAPDPDSGGDPRRSTAGPKSSDPDSGSDSATSSGPESRSRSDVDTGEWDPAWPITPYEPIGLDDVTAHPGRCGPGRHDRDWEDYDGPQQWPSDWPGRWTTDSAVTAAVTAAAGDSSHGHDGAGAGAGQTTNPHPQAESRNLPGASPPSAGPPGSSNPRAARPPAPARSGGAVCQRQRRDSGATASGTAGPMPGPRRGTVDLQVPLLTLLQLAEHPGELAGWGPVVADIARHIAERNSDGTWRFTVTNELGEVAWTGITRKRPAAQTAAFVRARDHTCIAPGCRQPARTCDIDHTTGKAHGGHSGPTNLGCLCRMHHLFKSADGTHLVQLAPGSFGWITPRHLQYTRRAHRPLEL